jgi:hypothetical protein
VAPPRRRLFDPDRRCAMGRSVGRSFRLEALRSVVLDCLVLVCLGQPGRPPRASSHALCPARLAARGGPSRRATQCAQYGGGRVHPRRQPGEFDPLSAALASIAVEGSPRLTLGVSLSPPTDEVLKTASGVSPAGSRSPGISARSPAGSRSPLPTPPPSPPPSMATTNQLRLPSLQRQRPWPVLPPPSRLGRGSRAPTQAPAAPAEEPKLPPKRQLTQPKPFAEWQE